VGSVILAKKRRGKVRGVRLRRTVKVEVEAEGGGWVRWNLELTIREGKVLLLEVGLCRLRSSSDGHGVVFERVSSGGELVEMGSEVLRTKERRGQLELDRLGRGEGSPLSSKGIEGKMRDIGEERRDTHVRSNHQESNSVRTSTVDLSVDLGLWKGRERTRWTRKKRTRSATTDNTFARLSQLERCRCREGRLSRRRSSVEVGGSEGKEGSWVELETHCPR